MNSNTGKSREAENIDKENDQAVLRDDIPIYLKDDQDDDCIYNDDNDEKGGLCLNEYQYVRAKMQFFDQ